MKLTRFESAMLWVIAIADKIERAFLKVYPTTAILFSIVYAYGLIGGLDRNRISTADFYNAIYVAIGLTILTLLYLVLSLRKKLRGE